MSSSDSSEDGRGYGAAYTPILSDRFKSPMDSPATPAAAAVHQWPKDGVNVYSNELFTEPEPDLDDHGRGQAQAQARPGSAAKMQAQQKSLAQRRNERMQGNLYQSNDSGMARNANSPAPRPPYRPQQPEQNGQYAATQVSSMAQGLDAVFDPNEENGQYDSPARSHRQMQMGLPQPTPPPPRRLDTSDIPTFLMQPGPMNGPVMCYIVRDKGSAKMYPKYTLFLEDGRRFLLAARKRKKQTTSNYLVSLDYDDLARESDKYFGKLRANFVGTEFTIFDGGAKDGKQSDDGARQELGCVTYQYNVLGTRGPRKMTGVIPSVGHDGQRVDATNMLERVKANKGLEDMVVMRNKPPRWNEELNAYCLNFNGRVTEASVKNFQLVTDDNQNHVILQFGKIGKNTFTMDYQWPICGFQAFCICLSSFDNKLACE